MSILREYFLAADRGDVYIIKGHKNLKSFISLLLFQKECIQKITFLKRVCLGVGFPSQVSSLKGLGHAILGIFSTDRMVIELAKISK